DTLSVSVTVVAAVTPNNNLSLHDAIPISHEATNLSVGTYTVTIEDANRCTTTETFTITEPTALNVVPTQVNVLCNGAATGSVSVTVSGGSAPYSCTWNKGSTSPTHEATNL